MLLWIWTRNDETGLLDDEFRDGDILQTKPDSFEPSLGTQEKKSYLIVKIPDPPNLAKVATDLVTPEYMAGQTPEENVIRRKCRYTLDWRTKFVASEIATVEDANAMLADGTLESGGTVVSGVVSGKFSIMDFRRK